MRAEAGLALAGKAWCLVWQESRKASETSESAGESGKGLQSQLGSG